MEATGEGILKPREKTPGDAKQQATFDNNNRSKAGAVQDEQIQRRLWTFLWKQTMDANFITVVLLADGYICYENEANVSKPNFLLFFLLVPCDAVWMKGSTMEEENK